MLDASTGPAIAHVPNIPRKRSCEVTVEPLFLGSAVRYRSALKLFVPAC